MPRGIKMMRWRRVRSVSLPSSKDLDESDLPKTHVFCGTGRLLFDKQPNDGNMHVTTKMTYGSAKINENFVMMERTSGENMKSLPISSVRRIVTTTT